MLQNGDDSAKPLALSAVTDDAGLASCSISSTAIIAMWPSA
jgi:hypothetical protein